MYIDSLIRNTYIFASDVERVFVVKKIVLTKLPSVKEDL